MSRSSSSSHAQVRARWPLTTRFTRKGICQRLKKKKACQELGPFPTPPFLIQAPLGFSALFPEAQKCVSPSICASTCEGTPGVTVSPPTLPPTPRYSRHTGCPPRALLPPGPRSCPRQPLPRRTRLFEGKGRGKRYQTLGVTVSETVNHPRGVETAAGKALPRWSRWAPRWLSDYRHV